MISTGISSSSTSEFTIQLTWFTGLGSSSAQGTVKDPLMLLFFCKDINATSMGSYFLPFLFLNAPHWMHWRATPACLGFIQWRMTECWPLLIYATKPCGGQLYRIFTFCAYRVTHNSFIIQVLSWIPEELPASSVASSASAIHHLHPRTTDCWTLKHTHENAGICSWIDLLPFIECPTIQSSSVSFYMSKSHHACLSPFLCTFLKLGKQRDAVKQRLCITKVLAGSSQHLPSCLCSN